MLDKEYMKIITLFNSGGKENQELALQLFDSQGYYYNIETLIRHYLFQDWNFETFEKVFFLDSNLDNIISDVFGIEVKVEVNKYYGFIFLDNKLVGKKWNYGNLNRHIFHQMEILVEKTIPKIIELWHKQKKIV